MKAIDKATALKTKLDELLRSTGKTLGVDSRTRLSWNHHSNQLDGNSLTFSETEALLNCGLTAASKPLEDHLKITGHDAAITWILRLTQTGHNISEGFIRELHSLIRSSPFQVKAITFDGKLASRWLPMHPFKTVANDIETDSGVTIRFAQPREAAVRLNELIVQHYTALTESNINPIRLAASFHYRFMRISPFPSGNGATARMLMNLILMQFGYPLSSSKKRTKPTT